MPRKAKNKGGRPTVAKCRDPHTPGPKEYGGGVVLTPPEIMNKREVAAYLRITVPKVDEMRAAGQLKSFKLGERSVRFRKSDIDAYIAKLVKAEDRRRKARLK